MDEQVTNNGAAPEEGKGLSIAALVLGIVSLIAFCFNTWVSLICAIIGIVLAALSLKKQAPGKGMAIAGLVCSIVAVVGTIIALILVAIGVSYLAGLGLM